MNTPFRGARFAAAVIASILFSGAARSADVRLYVQFASGQKTAVQTALAQQNARTHYEFDDLNVLAVSIPAAAQAALTRNPDVVLIEEDPRREFLSQTIPYGITMVQAPTAVSAGATGAGITIGVIDSGVFFTHEDLSAVAIDGEPDFGPSDQRTWYRDILSHGTHVVGTLAAADNGLGVLGVSPGAVGIHMVKVFGDTGNWVYSSDLLAAVRVAVAKGARVINMSLGGARKTRTEQNGMDDLYNNKGALLVAAAGNDGTGALSYPASYNSVISVAALDSNEVVASFSQHNNQVELAAPGVAVLSTVSYLEQSDVTVNGTTYDGNSIENAAHGNATAPLIYGGLGTATDASWSGKVVLLDRGTNTFNEKVQNVQTSGGVACVIANNVPGNFLGTLGDGNSSTIPAISVSQQDGGVLQTLVGSSAAVRNTVTQPASGYAEFDGTSMATPHVAGAAALIWSKYPGATNAQVRQALDNSAQDLGSAGRDSTTAMGSSRPAPPFRPLPRSIPPRRRSTALHPPSPASQERPRAATARLRFPGRPMSQPRATYRSIPRSRRAQR